MDWKEFFRPNKWKIILSLVVTIIIFLLIFLFRPWCGPCEVWKIRYENWPEIILSCDCTIGSTFPEFIKDLFIVFLIQQIFN